MIHTDVKLTPPFDALANEIENNSEEIQFLRERIIELEKQVAGLKTKYSKVKSLLYEAST